MKFKAYRILACSALVVMGLGCTVSNKGEKAAGNQNNDTAGERFVNIVEEESSDPESWFEIRDIDDETFNRIQGKSYKANCTVPREDLRYLTVAHYTLEGDVKKGELICNKLIADDLIDIFKNLYDAKYPIERMELVDEYDADDRKSMTANNTSCFNFRVVAGSKTLSNHARGLAIDINPRYNPYVKKQKDGSLYVSPKNGTAYADRKADFPYKIDEEDLCYKEFKKHGFTWGGAWKTMQDYQHFEKKIPGLPY